MTWYFSVRNNGAPVTDLSRDDVSVLVDGVDPGVEGGLSLNRDNKPFVQLLLDASYSITEADAEGSVKEGARAFVEGMPEGTWFVASQFASEESVPIGLEPSCQPLPSVRAAGTALNAYDAYGVVTSAAATKLFDAVSTGAAELNATQVRNATRGGVGLDVLATKQRILVALSDGSDTASNLVASAADTRGYLDRCGVRAFTLSLGSDIDEATLDTIAGEDTLRASTADDLAASFEAVATELKSYYSLRVVTADPIAISASSSLTLDYRGETLTATFTPPSETCEAPRLAAVCVEASDEEELDEE
jgi:hypothetical protein